jgi:hypothetical protein
MVPSTGKSCSVFRVRVVCACERSCVRGIICRTGPLRRKCVLLLLLMLCFVALRVPVGVPSRLVSRLVPRLVPRLVSRVVSRLVSRMVSRLVSRLIPQPAYHPKGGRIGIFPMGGISIISRT